MSRLYSKLLPLAVTSFISIVKTDIESQPESKKHSTLEYKFQSINKKSLFRHPEPQLFHVQVSQWNHKKAEDSWAVLPVWSQKDNVQQVILGVFDGHIGKNCAKLASYSVPLAVRLALEQNPFPVYQPLFESAFRFFDDFIMPFFFLTPTENDLLENIVTLAFQGSCACLAVMDFKEKKVHVANLGDSRLLLVTLETEQALTQDANARTEYGRQLVCQQHPEESEKELFQRGYVKGRIQPVQVLGDAHLKLSEEQTQVFAKAYIKDLKKDGPYLSPPYLTNIPSYSEVDVHLDQGNVLVMVTDGITHVLKNQQIGDIVRLESTKSHPNYSSSILESALKASKHKKRDDMTVIALYECDDVSKNSTSIIV
jgi:serine/threonine protein phosphatase PrpC